VKQEDGQLRILAQSDLVKFLFPYIKDRDFVKQSIKDAHLATYPALTHVTTKSALDGIRKIRIHEVHTLALVDENGDLKGSFSETELRGLSQSTLGTLLNPSGDFVKSHAEGNYPPIVTLLDDESVVSAIQKFVEGGAHQMWVVEGTKPVGCVTLSNLLLFFWNNLMPLWTDL